MKTTTPNTKNYEEVKATLKARFSAEDSEIKYPTTMNGLTDEFIKEFIIELKKVAFDEAKALASERKRIRSSEEKKNWFPAYRSYVGKKYFSEFGYKKTKNNTDEIGDELDALFNEDNQTDTEHQLAA